MVTIIIIGQTVEGEGFTMGEYSKVGTFKGRDLYFDGINYFVKV